MNDGKGGYLGAKMLICTQQNFDNCFTLQRKGIDLESRRVKQLRTTAFLKFKQAVDISIDQLQQETFDKKLVFQDQNMQARLTVDYLPEYK